ncbi:MAG: sigma-54-dependent Fis family transcriptional regulator [Rhodomicrobium sp.]|nr:MAG: sigma-54-dependent Fis family transcriptional regulator [Rhodomicrobium sp.]
MRLTIIGSLHGNLTLATKIAMESGAKVTHAATIDTALDDLCRGQGADLIMIEDNYDIRALVEKLEGEHIHVPVIACGSGENTRAAVSAIQAGAKEYIPLPPDAELIAAILTAVSKDQKAMIYRDPIMSKTIALADQVAGSDASILITGESGTGKEVMAQYLHTQSPRSSKKFISVNCAAIPENLLESELFGHEKGAFTGALQRRIGKFEEANGGTLLLDEISEMDIRLQAKLLRAIQERVIDRVGGSKPVPVDIRIIATSNRNLQQAVKDGIFREDLLYRLNVVNLAIPALRERREDILALSQHFVEKYSSANGMPGKRLTNETLEVLKSAEWPGNVRELENTIHRAVLLSIGNEIEPDAIRPPEALSSSSDEPAAAAAATAEALSNTLVGMTVAEVERDLILNTLDHCIGNRTHAANILGISIRTLRNKLKQYSDEGLDIPLPNEQRGFAS